MPVGNSLFILSQPLVRTFALIALASAAVFSLGSKADETGSGPAAGATPTAVIGSETEPSLQTLYPAPLVSIPESSGFAEHILLVDKSTRTLKVYRAKGDLLELLESHPTDIGKNSGDKERANDHKTPVGIYFLMEKKQQPEIPFSLYGSLAFTTDYPNIFDKRTAKGGSGIWLHAVPDQVPLTRGSRGCVVVRNEVIQHLQKFVQLQQTPIVIADKVDYLTKEQYLQQKKEYLDNFEKWRLAWETSDVDTYMQFYDPTFRNAQMNYNQWQKHKAKLKKLYSFIKVSLTTPLILHSRQQVVVRTVQDYESNLHKDIGEKTIHAHYSDTTGFKIIREDWKPSKASN
jgi:murein L,D-transpeptidase YafK